ncbi:hypothetical protein A3Q56_07651 [Intoshia linei]|uniref:PiggyBac transposable element-derived protein domain-containing protein n=1 Tax=Intoshia linei TaxID=1819745 RepID=A0A177ARJ6_9BILA|nr:hypothetical protein A3Q56_07651 [Intoshia linei]
MTSENTLNNLLDNLDKNNDTCNNIFIEPPELTDADSAGSEDEATNLVSALNGNQLRAQAEFRQIEDDDLPLASLSKVKHFFKWNLKKNEVLSPPFPEKIFVEFRDFTPIKFFDDEVMHHIVTQSNIYASQKNNNSILTIDELKTFIDISNAIRRNQYDNIMKTIHLQDNVNLDYTDKYSKIRPLIKFMKYFVPSQNICHDEAMIECFGKHGSIRLRIDRCILPRESKALPLNVKRKRGRPAQAN